jgi:hypothetical protein
VADPWAKVWWTWYTSRSHIGLSGVALALGAPLMLIGRACAKRHSDGHSDGECDAKRDGSCDDKKGEGRSKSNSSSAEPKPATLVKAVKPRKRSERDGMFDLVRDVFEAAHMAAHGVPAGVSGSLVSRLVEKWVKPMAPEKRADAVRQAVAGFFADPYWREQGKHPFAQFEQQPGAFVKQASPASSGSLGDQGWRVGLP